MRNRIADLYGFPCTSSWKMNFTPAASNSNINLKNVWMAWTNNKMKNWSKKWKIYTTTDEPFLFSPSSVSISAVAAVDGWKLYIDCMTWISKSFQTNNARLHANMKKQFYTAVKANSYYDQVTFSVRKWAVIHLSFISTPKVGHLHFFHCLRNCKNSQVQFQKSSGGNKTRIKIS